MSACFPKYMMSVEITTSYLQHTGVMSDRLDENLQTKHGGMNVAA